MQRYILRRLVQALLVLWVVSVLVFLLGHVSGDPADVLLPIEATREDRQLLRERWGLDKPLPEQYVIFLTSALRGDLGMSYTGAREVSELLAQRLPNSARLAGVAMLIALVAGLLLGIASAVRKDTPVDYVARMIAVLGQSVPSFLIALLAMELFGVWLRLLPVSGMGSPWHYVLPATASAWVTTAAVLRLLRSSMLEVMDSEYVKLARIKGVSEAWVIGKHVVRNALIPVVTFSGMQFAAKLSALVVIETVFVWPGIGRLAYEAILERDFPVIRGVILAIAVVVTLVNLLVDIIYAYLDPRIRYR